MEKFGFVDINSGMNAWTNEFSYAGRVELQNKLQGKSITKKTIMDVFTSTPFMAIGGSGKARRPELVEIKQFFPEDGKVLLGCYYNAENKWGGQVNLKWEPKKEKTDDYETLLKKYNDLEKRVAMLEKLVLAK